MTPVQTDADIVRFRLRDCWVHKDNRRLSTQYPGERSEFCIHALVVEWVAVKESHRRQGYFTRWLASLVLQAREKGYDLLIIEGVQNPLLANALANWDWEYDRQVMDFYLPLTQAPS